MKISALEEYGLRCMIHLARHEEKGSIAISELARAEGLSVPYVAKVMRKLRRSELVRSERGPSGGYSLYRPAAGVTVAEVQNALSGPIYSSSFCDEHSGSVDCCVHETDCAVRMLWSEIQGAIDRVLRRVTLHDLANGAAHMHVCAPPSEEAGGGLPMLQCGGPSGGIQVEQSLPVTSGEG